MAEKQYNIEHLKSELQRISEMSFDDYIVNAVSVNPNSQNLDNLKYFIKPEDAKFGLMFFTDCKNGELSYLTEDSPRYKEFQKYDIANLWSYSVNYRILMFLFGFESANDIRKIWGEIAKENPNNKTKTELKQLNFIIEYINHNKKLNNFKI